MGLILLAILLPVCLVAIYRRRGTRKSLVVPMVVLVYAVVSALWFLVSVIRMFVDIVNFDASYKATLLAKGISELMNCAAFGLIVHIPLLVGAYFVDRWLVARSTT